MDMKDSLDILILDQMGKLMHLGDFDLSLILPQLRRDVVEAQCIEDSLLLFTRDGFSVPLKGLLTEI